MHLLTCPECRGSIPVATSQAGQRATCPECEKPVDVPTLGKLRQLPQDDIAELEKTVDDGPSGGRSTSFAILGLVATAALVVAGFCGIRWALIEVPMTTESHLRDFKEAYEDIDAAQLIREHEQMEEFAIDMVPAYRYKQIEITKADWGRSTMIAAFVAVICIGGAVVVGISGRKRK